MKKTVLIIVAVCSASIVQAQSKDREVVASGGGYSTTTGAQVSFTIGESVIQYHAQPAASLSQGFQQPDNNATSVFHVRGMAVKVSVYPNPFVSAIDITSEKKLNNVIFRLTDVSGKLIPIVSKEMRPGTHWRIQPEDVAAGNYWLTIDAEGKQNTYPLTHIAE